ncbi:MAG: hypothetical protein SRB2_01740 [Desulfobacteraceae bacterium Eth-SRB2]|nr:MAG: hypothetical protein SRB2_01740 [Desulfobacteraceae bacterium Eth-SRB2]
MDNNLSNVEISVQELKLLVNTLTKSVALSLRKRYTWLGVIAGLLIGICLTLAIISLTWKQTDKITTTTQTLLEKSRETLSELKLINSKISQLADMTPALNEKKQTDNKMSESTDEIRQIDSKISQLADTTPALNEKKQPDNKMSESTGAGKTKISSLQNIIQPGRYTVYVHYTNNKNGKLMERLSVFLTQTGFKVEGIQKVNYRNQDIRYFHDEDKEGAVVLKKHLSAFIPPITSIKNPDIRIINLSRKYPNAKKGALELWLNLNF